MPIKFPFFRTRKVKCSDGNDRFIYNYIDDIFPLSVSDREAKLSGGLKIPETVDVSLAADIKNAINSLIFSIDGNNKSLILEQRAAYLHYASNPCGLEEWHGKRQDDISRRMQRLQ